MKKARTWGIWRCLYEGCLFEIRFRTRPPTKRAGRNWRYARLLGNAYDRLVQHEYRCGHQATLEREREGEVRDGG